MEIIPLGLTSFKIKGKKATVVVNPSDHKFSDSVDVVTIADDFKTPEFLDAWRKHGYVVYGPGEYEISGVDVIGVGVMGNTVYNIRVDGVSVCHLGNLKSKLTSEQQSEIGDVDVLILPLGKGLGPELASSVVAQLEPEYVIPTDGKESVDKFLKEMGTQTVVSQPKLVTSADKLPETTTFVVLE